MKSQKGITLTSLVIYIVVLLIVLGLLSNISKYFYSNTKYITDAKTIYRNKVEICKNVQICTFDKVEETDTNGFTKQIIKVKFAVKSSEIFVKENNYVLKYW